MPNPSKKPDIIISITKGIIQIEKKPTKITILIKDYDIQEENEDILKDKNGYYQSYLY
jgi:hypothetical protein